MSLFSSSDEQIFESFENLLLRVNEHVASQDYVVILLRIKKFKLGVKRKAWIICDRDDRMKAAKEKKRRHIINRCIEYFFSLVAKRMNDNNDNSWSLKMINDQHNHSFIFADAHSVQRKIALTSEIRNDIAKQLRVQTKSSQILSSFRIFDFIDSSSSDSENSVVINSLFKSRDIYNLKTKLHREFLKSLTSIQALIRELNETNWTYEMQKNVDNHITHLFFVKQTSQIVLKSNYEILVMNCTYKINRYKFSLLVISDQIVLHSNFYVAFCFMKNEITADYVWILQQLRALYVQLKFSNSTIIVTNMKKDLLIRSFVFSH
jgi:head-tail adaptor